MKSVLLAVAALLLSASLVLATAAAPKSSAGGPLPVPGLTSAGSAAPQISNPVLAPTPRGAAAETSGDYRPGVDFLGSAIGVPLNPSVALQAKLADDKQFLTSILRSPTDLGDIAACKHSDLEKDERELRKIAQRLNARRVSGLQQQQWIDSATEGLKKIETEIAASTETARNLAEQLDTLHAQRDDIANHVRRAIQLKELDATSTTLNRLKTSRLSEEVRLQKKHNGFVIQNAQHNDVLKKLHHMRSAQGLELGQLHDPKPYRFAQVEQEEASEADVAQGQETEAEVSAEGDAEAEGEAETEADAEGETEADADAEADAETEGEAEADSE